MDVDNFRAKCESSITRDMLPVTYNMYNLEEEQKIEITHLKLLSDNIPLYIKHKL